MTDSNKISTKIEDQHNAVLDKSKNYEKTSESYEITLKKKPSKRRKTPLKRRKTPLKSRKTPLKRRKTPDEMPTKIDDQHDAVIDEAKNYEKTYESYETPSKRRKTSEKEAIRDEAPNLFSKSSTLWNLMELIFKMPIICFDLGEAEDFKESSSLFTLDDLCPKKYANDPELTFFKYIKVEFADFIHSKWQIFYKSHSVPLLEDELADCITTVSIKPDFLIVSEIQHPLLFAEVVSDGNYLDTVYTSASNLVDQLRFLRLYYDINYVIGFVLPSFNEACLATQITVEWKQLQFCASYKHLSMEEFKTNFKNVLINQCTAITELPKCSTYGEHYFIRLTEEDLQLLEKIVHTKTDAKTVEKKEVTQHISKFSILFYDAEFFYKIVPFREDPYPLLTESLNRKHESFSISNFLVNQLIYQLNSQSFSHFVLPDRLYKFSGKSIWRFPRQPCGPFTMSQAKNCLADLVSKVKVALDDLHTFRYVHGDVRLPNICFTHEGEVKLIDLDRASHGDIFRHNFGSKMKVKMKRMTKRDFDFHMFGIMILDIMYGISSQDVLKIEEFRSQYNDETFLEKLIYTFDDALFETFKSANRWNTVYDVLTSLNKS